MEEPTSISKIFNPREYLNFYYQNTEANIDREVNEFLLDKLHEYIQKGEYSYITLDAAVHAKPILFDLLHA